MKDEGTHNDACRFPNTHAHTHTHTRTKPHVCVGFLFFSTRLSVFTVASTSTAIHKSVSEPAKKKVTHKKQRGVRASNFVFL